VSAESSAGLADWYRIKESPLGPSLAPCEAEAAAAAAAAAAAMAAPASPAPPRCVWGAWARSCWPSPTPSPRPSVLLRGPRAPDSSQDVQLVEHPCGGSDAVGTRQLVRQAGEGSARRAARRWGW